jgi:hypothetical protein
MSEAVTPPYPYHRYRANETTPDNQKETRWEEVAATSGLTAAQILVGRLQSENIPARAWQESVGQATGLVVGLLGTGHVIVPEAYAERAREILGDVDSYIDEDDEDSLK